MRTSGNLSFSRSESGILHKTANVSGLTPGGNGVGTPGLIGSLGGIGVAIGLVDALLVNVIGGLLVDCGTDGTAVVCDGTAVVCDGTAVVCDDMAVVCDGTAVVCDGTAVICNGTAVVCDGTAVVCDGAVRALDDGRTVYLLTLPSVNLARHAGDIGILPL